jgi:hypothetical protein
MKKPAPVSEPFSLGAFAALCGGWHRPARVASLSDAALLRFLGAHRYVVDVAVLEAERRGLVPLDATGAPIIPYHLPDGVTPPTTILNCGTKNAA